MNKDNNFKAALNRAMKLSASREYCSEDILGKLKAWGVSQENAARIIETLVKEKFIDNRRFAEAYVKDKYHQNRWGRLKIIAGLKMKNIPAGLINESLQVIDEDDYRQSAIDILLSRRKSIKAKSLYELKGKLMRYGQSKGFENEILYDLLNEID